MDLYNEFITVREAFEFSVKFCLYLFIFDEICVVFVDEVLEILEFNFIVYRMIGMFGSDIGLVLG